MNKKLAGFERLFLSFGWRRAHVLAANRRVGKDTLGTFRYGIAAEIRWKGSLGTNMTPDVCIRWRDSSRKMLHSHHQRAQIENETITKEVWSRFLFFNFATKMPSKYIHDKYLMY